MKAIVFAGPSISRQAVESRPGLEWRPPVSQGDVFRAVQSRPTVIAIVDGYFEGVPSVWHKEILWAMSRGIHVFGASSMGALRAAELYQFGMRGVGEIFEKYRDGIYTDDDEVAVLHGPAETGYLSLSLPMVNARATIDSALNASIISDTDAEKITNIAKSLFYQKRNWADVIAAANRARIDSAILFGFEAWLATGEQDVKRQDAESLLGELSRFLTTDVEPMQCGYTFEWTVMWDSVVSGQSGEPTADNGDVAVCIEQLVIDELRLDPQKFRQLTLRARLKQMALREAGRKRFATDPGQTRKQLHALRELLGLYSRAQLDEWIEQVDWNADALLQALEDEQRRNAAVDRLGTIDEQILLDELRLWGDYTVLKARAEAKRDVNSAAAAECSVLPAELLIWYFESQLGESIPADLDAYLAEIGIYKRSSFYHLLEKQFLFTLALNAETQ